jgi:acyl-coenzyme A synthetase/AMP-(fatty) acid ligase
MHTAPDNQRPDPGHLSRLEAFQAIATELHNQRTLLLYDPGFQNIQRRIASLDPSTIEQIDAAALLFTSGTTGTPIGAFKSHDNLLSEIAALRPLLGQPRAVISTVPQIHLYGLLFGLMVPLAMGATPVIKENFLPTELIWLAKDFAPAIIVTTPVFIKALNRISEASDLKGTLFVSSTGHLDPQEAGLFEQRFNARVLSIYGSTETGGVGYRLGAALRWKPLEGVKISQDNENLSVRSNFVSTLILKEDIQPTESTITMSDVVHIHDDNTFEIIGRNKELIKIAGKRLSLIEIEEAIEKECGGADALVLAGAQPEGIKETHLAIYLASHKPKVDLQTTLRKLLRQLYPALNIRFKLTLVEQIARNPMGKKLRQHPKLND